MNILVVLIPASLLLGGVGLAGFLWLLRTNQYEDPEGQATRVLSSRYDDHPAPDPAPARREPADRPTADAAAIAPDEPPARPSA